MEQIKSWFTELNSGMTIAIMASFGGLVGTLAGMAVGYGVDALTGQAKAIELFAYLGLFIGFFRFLPRAARTYVREMDTHGDAG